VAHQALQKGRHAATHFQHQLLKRLLGGLPDPAIVVLIDNAMQIKVIVTNRKKDLNALKPLQNVNLHLSASPAEIFPRT